jgi:hypothetical protein
VAESHGGTVTLEHPASGIGTRFVIRLPLETEAATLAEPAAPSNGAAQASNAAAQTSTTTGSTIGRRRSRS